MKKLVVFVILLLLLTLWGFGVILPDAGYLLVILGQKTLETSLWFACFAILSICLLWWLAKQFISASWSFAQRITDFFVFGNTERASRRAASGLIDFLSGDWLQARKKLLRTAAKVESPLVNYLAAARCSHELGDRHEARSILADAQKKFPRFHTAIGLVQVKMELQDGRQDHAKDILLALKQKSPKNVVILNHLRKIYEANQDFVALADIFTQVKATKACSLNETLDMEASVIIGQLKQASIAASKEPQTDRFKSLRKTWGKAPSYQQKNPRVTAAYAQALIENFQDPEAEILLRKSLTTTWDDNLINFYGLLRVKDLAECIRYAENWLKYQPQNPVLLRTIGRLNLRNHSWTVAREYFQRSLEAQRDVETYAELARLLHNLGETQNSLETYQAALSLRVPVLPDLPQPTRAY